MNFNALLKVEVQDFIEANNLSKVSTLALKKNPFADIEYATILNQIENRQKSKIKLPTWYSTKNIIYPAKVSIEQTSSEITAQYKSKIIAGESLIDLTGGFGVDDFYFAKSFQKVVHCDLNTELSAIVAHNFKQLHTKNIQCIAGESLMILNNLSQKFSWIYLDPSRRNDFKVKVFLLNDCLPNVPKLLLEYLRFTDNILLKTAPILDIKAGITELIHVKKIHIVAVENEVKELLWEIEKNYAGSIEIVTVNFTKIIVDTFNFIIDNLAICSNYSLPQQYLYEPNSAIMKSGGFNEIGLQFNLNKLHQHSHLYTSATLQAFPGRIFKVEKSIYYCKKEMKIHFENTKKNITIRNFPETVETIRKKWNIKEGGDDYCFFTTDRNNNKIVLICKKINTAIS